MDALIGPLEQQFLLIIALSIVIGLLIGVERELRGKDAGISTHILVIAGAALFALLSNTFESGSTHPIAAGVVMGIGFLGAGLILKDGGPGSHVRNLTTAASLWFAGAIGIALGFGFYMLAIIGGIACALIPLIPSVRRSDSAP